MKSAAGLRRIITLVKSHLEKNEVDYGHRAFKLLDDRLNGREFTFNDYLKAMIYAQLSNQTRWSNIEPKLSAIDKLFFNYNPDQILKKKGTYYYAGLLEIKCGNICTRRQMEALHSNINTLRQIERDHGSLDHFCRVYQPERLVREISGGAYKLKYLGPALAWEFLRNVGLDGVKPDVHLRRLFGRDRLGLTPSARASESEVIDIVNRMSRLSGCSRSMIDSLFWNHCTQEVSGCCRARPKCEGCVIKRFCNYPKERIPNQ